MQRLLCFVAAVMLFGAHAWAAEGDQARRFKDRASAQINERFTRADANGDGQLTRDEAKASMPRIHENFDRIDVEHKGYVTYEQVYNFAIEQLAERHSSKGS